MVVGEKHIFSQLVGQKTVSESLTLEQVNQWIKKYPAFHSAHLIKGFLLNKSSEADFQQALPNIATHVVDRGRLYDVVQPDTEWNIAEAAVLTTEIFTEEVTPQSNDMAEEVTECVDKEVEQAYVESNQDEELEEIDAEVNSILDEAAILQEERVVVEEQAIADVSEEREDVAERIDLSIEKKEEISSVDKANLSFVEWLKLKKKGEAVEEVALEDAPLAFEMPSAVEVELLKEGQRTTDKLESYISTQIQRKRKQKPAKSKDNVVESKAIVSETYAEILVLQKKYDEAIKTYQTLSLKYPQKSTFFARQIEKVKKHL